MSGVGLRFGLAERQVPRKALPLDGWPNWVLGNHDRPRVAAKRGQA
jgi:hypothetical protein